MLGWGGHGRPHVSMEPRRLRGSERCEKCQVNMEVHLTYHKCPVCGRVKKKGGMGYRERSAQIGEKRKTFIERMQQSINVSSAPSSAEFIELEPGGATAVERVFFWVLAVASGLYVHLQFLAADSPQMLNASWGHPFLFHWLPLLLFLATLAAVFHSDLRFRRIMVFCSLAAALGCLLVLLSGYGAFHDELSAIYPSMDSVTLVGRRWRPLVTAQGGQVWLVVTGLFQGFSAWHIFHQERRHGRM